MGLVIIFIALVNLVFVLSYKHFATAIRVENTYRLARQRDEGTLLVLAAGLALLELETPTQTAAYEYKMSLGDPGDEVWYTLTYELESSLDGVETWSVVAELPEFPNDSLPDLRERIQYLVANPPAPPEPSEPPPSPPE